jgi:hypothetical protein
MSAVIVNIFHIIALDNLEKLSYKATIPISILKKVQLRARALVNNEIIQIRPFKMSSRKLGLSVSRVVIDRFLTQPIS